MQNMQENDMRRRTEDSPVTRRMIEHRLDEVFATITGARVLINAREAGLIRTGKQGTCAESALTAEDRMTLIVLAALACGTNLTLKEATRLMEKRRDWLREAMACAATGADLKLRPAVAGDVLAVEVTIRNAALRDPIIGMAA